MKMKLTILSLLAAGSMALATATPASAISPMPQQSVPIASDAAPIQVRDHMRNDNRVYIYKGQRYYNGHPGERIYRDGYRRHNGFWYPRSAFSLGIIIAPGIQQRVIRSYGGSRHINWCENRYRSYRISNNSWKPNHGPRRVCVSPYY